MVDITVLWCHGGLGRLSDLATANYSYTAYIAGGCTMASNIKVASVSTATGGSRIRQDMHRHVQDLCIEPAPTPIGILRTRLLKIPQRACPV